MRSTIHTASASGSSNVRASRSPRSHVWLLAAIIAFGLYLMGQSAAGAIGLGLALALSSTAIVLPLVGTHSPVGRSAHWVTPTLVCEATFIEQTAAGVLRAPSFQGLRPEIRAKDVTAT